MASFQESDQSSPSHVSHSPTVSDNSKTKQTLGGHSDSVTNSGKKRATSVLEDPQVQDWMEKVKNLQSDREREDEERQRKLEQDIIAERKARQARRAERTRSLSPDKTVSEAQQPLPLMDNQQEPLLGGIKSHRSSFSQSPSRELEPQLPASSTPVLSPPSRDSQPTSPLKQVFEPEDALPSEIEQALALGDTPVLKPFEVFPSRPPDRPRSNTGTFDSTFTTPKTPTKRERPVSIAGPSSGRERTVLPDSPLSLRQSHSSFQERPLSYPLTQGNVDICPVRIPQNSPGSPISSVLPTSPSSSVRDTTYKDRPISPTKGAGGFVASALMRTDSSLRSRTSAPASPASPLNTFSNTPPNHGVQSPLYSHSPRPIDFSRTRAESNPSKTSLWSSFYRKHSVPNLSHNEIEATDFVPSDDKEEESHDQSSTVDSRSATSTTEPPPSISDTSSAHESSHTAPRRKVAGRDSPELGRFKRSPPESILMPSFVSGSQSPTTPVRSPEISHKRLSPTKNTWMDAALKRETVIKKLENTRTSPMNKTPPAVRKSTPSPKVEKVVLKKLSPREPLKNEDCDLVGQLKTGKSALKACPPAVDKVDSLKESLLVARANLASKRTVAEINGPRVDEVKQRLLAAKNSLSSIEKGPKKHIDPVLERLKNAKSSLRPKANLENSRQVTPQSSVSKDLLSTLNDYRNVNKSVLNKVTPKGSSVDQESAEISLLNVDTGCGDEGLTDKFGNSKDILYPDEAFDETSSTKHDSPNNPSEAPQNDVNMESPSSSHSINELYTTVNKPLEKENFNRSLPQSTKKLSARINPQLSDLIGKSGSPKSYMKNSPLTSSTTTEFNQIMKNRPRGPKRRVPNQISLQSSLDEKLPNNQVTLFEAELVCEQSTHNEDLDTSSDDSCQCISLLSNSSPEEKTDVTLEHIPQQIPDASINKALSQSPDKLKPRKLVKKPRSPSPSKGSPSPTGKPFSKFRQSTSYQRFSSFLGGKLPEDDPNFDISSIYNLRPKHFIYPEGQFNLQVWRLIDGKREPLISAFSTVYEDDALLYLATLKDSQIHQSTAFLWLGSNKVQDNYSFINSYVKEQDAKLVVPVRIHQGKETPTFLSLIGGILITKYGSRDIQVQTASLFCIRYSSPNIFIDQRKLDVSSLCSAYSYVFKSYDAVWVWIGRGSQESEVISAHDFALSLKSSVRACYEGNEPEDFWDALGDGKYACAAFWRARRECKLYATRLFRIFDKQITEISPFGMDDINNDSIHVIDSFFDVTSVIGNQARGRRDDIQLALNFSKSYSLYAIKAENRQICMTSVLLAPWRFPSDLQAIFRLRLEVLPGCEFNSNLMQSMSLDDAFRIMDTKVFKIKDLQQVSLPLGVDPEHLDLWLSDKDYQLCMGLSRAEVVQKSEKEQEGIREDGLTMLRMLKC